MLNFSSLAADAGISHATARRWISILEASFVVYLLKPHYRSFNKRLVKSPKLYFLDTGLLCYLLRIRKDEELHAHACRGGVFETWVVSELLKACYNQAPQPDLYFWRDSSGHEIDLLIDRGDVLVPVGIKSGQTLGERFSEGHRILEKPRRPSRRSGRPGLWRRLVLFAEQRRDHLVAGLGMRAGSPGW